MAIDLSLSAPLVVSTTTTKTYVSFTITDVDFNISEHTVTISLTKTTDTGVIETDTLVLRDEQYNTFMSNVSTENETMLDLGARTASAAVMTAFGFNATVS